MSLAHDGDDLDLDRELRRHEVVALLGYHQARVAYIRRAQARHIHYAIRANLYLLTLYCLFHCFSSIKAYFIILPLAFVYHMVIA